MQIDGKAINQQIGQSLNEQINEKGVVPRLGILCVGDDPASLSFINVKKKFGQNFGFEVNILNIKEETEVSEVKAKLMELQSQNDSVIVQLPLPAKFRDETQNILSTIEKTKDVDNLNEGDFEAPIVLALEEVFKIIPPFGKGEKIGLIGLGQVVGMPIKNYLDKDHQNKNYSLEIIKKGEESKLKSCDVVISGVGKPFLIKKEMLKEGCVLVDYGCSFVDGKACGDFDQDCFEIASYYTPVPGCMGPLVVACLFKNVLKSIKI